MYPVPPDHKWPMKDNALDEVAQHAQDAYDDKDYDTCRHFLDQYKDWRRYELPGFQVTDGWIRELEKDLTEIVTGDEEGRLDKEALAIDQKPYKDWFRDPDKFNSNGSITFIYGGQPPSLFLREYGNDHTHEDMLKDPKINQHVFSGTRYEGRTLNPLQIHPFAQTTAILGRVSADGIAISIWNQDPTITEKLMPGAVSELQEKGLINGFTTIYAPCYDGPLNAMEVSDAHAHELSPEAKQRLDLQQQLHLARGDDKKAIMKKLGVGGGGKQHLIAPVMQRIGRLSPGHKWWASSSESFQRRLNIVLNESNDKFFQNIVVNAQEALWAYKYDDCQRYVDEYTLYRDDEPREELDQRIEEIKKALYDAKHPPTSSAKPDLLAVDDWADDSFNFDAYEKRGENPAFKDWYKDPDVFYSPGSITIIYGTGGLFMDEYPINHTQLMWRQEIQHGVLDGTKYEPEIGNQDIRFELWYQRGLQFSLFGRVSKNGRYLCFWNTNIEVVNKFVKPAVQALLDEGLINEHTTIMVPVFDQPVQVKNLDSASVQELSPEANQRLGLQQQLHLLRGDEKKAAMKKLGVGGGGKQHPITPVMQRIGRLSPGHKWWASSSEHFERRLNMVLESFSRG